MYFCVGRGGGYGTCAGYCTNNTKMMPTRLSKLLRITKEFHTNSTNKIWLKNDCYRDIQKGMLEM